MDLPGSGNRSPGRVLGAGASERVSTLTAIAKIFKYVRRVGLESTASLSKVGTVLGSLVVTQTSLEELVLGGGSINHVGDPSVPIYWLA